MNQRIIRPRTKQEYRFNRLLIGTYVRGLAKYIGNYEYEYEWCGSTYDLHTIIIPDVGKIIFSYYYDSNLLAISFNESRNIVYFHAYHNINYRSISEAVLKYANGQVDANEAFNRICEIRGHR